MDVQTVLAWAARLACPLAIGAMLWLMLRQTGSTSAPSTERHLADLQQHHAAVEHQIQVLEARADPSVPEGHPPVPDAQQSTR